MNRMSGLQRPKSDGFVVSGRPSAVRSKQNRHESVLVDFPGEGALAGPFAFLRHAQDGSEWELTAPAAFP